MATTSATADRVVTLDILRGVAVMGILAMNIVAFAMPISAYINPLAHGSDGPIDFASYAFNFILIDGKMRGLFSFLFGASMLLVIEKAGAKGVSPASVHFRRQFWLLLFGALHFYLVWFGDILFGYALIGLAAWFFRATSPKALIVWGVLLVLVQFLLMAGFAATVKSLAEAVARPGASAETVNSWNQATQMARVPTTAELEKQFALILGPWSGIVHSQVSKHLLDPLVFTFLFGAETLAYMLFGMAALKTGYLTGQWRDDEYRRAAVRGFIIALPFYLLLIWLVFRANFAVPALIAYAFAGTVLPRPFIVAAIAGLIIMMTRRGGWLTQRIAAAGRAAFTNYLGTSILMTGLFYGWGLGLYGALSRAELWLVVIPMWAVMLAWSKPWLDHFHYGPFEWLWRSLSRGEPQAMRKSARAAA